MKLYQVTLEFYSLCLVFSVLAENEQQARDLLTQHAQFQEWMEDYPEDFEQAFATMRVLDKPGVFFNSFWD